MKKTQGQSIRSQPPFTPHKGLGLNLHRVWVSLLLGTGLYLLLQISSHSLLLLPSEETAADRTPGTFLGDETTTNRYASVPKSEPSQQPPPAAGQGVSFGVFQQQPGITSPGSIIFDGSTSLGGMDQMGTSMKSAGKSIIQPTPQERETQIIVHPELTHPSLPVTTPPPQSRSSKTLPSSSSHSPSRKGESR